MNIIPKLQAGSNIPLVSYLSINDDLGTGKALTASSTKTEKEDDKNKIKLDDILKLALQIDGLPNDMQRTFLVIQKLFSESNLYDGEFDQGSLQTTYLSLLLLLRTCQFNKKLFENAQTLIDDNGGLHEVAIDQYGRVLTQNADGEIKHRLVSELKGLEGKEITLTNNDLLVLRANDPTLAYKNDVLSVVTNGVGYDKVLKLIQDTISKAGDSNVTLSGYSAKLSGEIKNGLELLAQAGRLLASQNENGTISYDSDLMTIDGLYKNKLITKDQKELMVMAYNYLMSTMPKNVSTWLTYKAQESGVPSKEYLVMSLLNSQSKSSYSFDSDYLENLNIDGSKKKDKNGSDDDKSNHYISIQNKTQGSYGTFELNSGTNNSLMVHGTKYGSLPDFSGKPVGSTSMSDLLTKGLSGIVEDMHGISFGDHVLDPNDLSNIWYDGSGGMMVDLPCKTVNGTKVVDLSILDEYNRAYEKFKLLDKENQTQENFATILADAGLYDLIGPDGLPNKNKFDQFLVVTGYGVDKENKFWQNQYGEKNRYLEEVDTNNEVLINRISQDLSTDSKKSNYEIDTENWFESSDPTGFFGYDHVYKGTMYIPISNNEGQGHNAAGQKLGNDVMHEDEYRYQIEQKRRNAKSASVSLLTSE